MCRMLGIARIIMASCISKWILGITRAACSFMNVESNKSMVYIYQIIVKSIHTHDKKSSSICIVKIHSSFDIGILAAPCHKSIGSRVLIDSEHKKSHS